MRSTHRRVATVRGFVRMWRQAVSIAVVAAFVVGVELLVGWRDVLAPWRNKSLAFIVLTTGLLMLSYTARALRMHRYFAIPGGFSRCMLVFLQHNMLVNLLPMRSGEFSFPLLMRQYFRMSAQRSVSALLWLRLLDLHVLMVLFATALAFVLPSPLVAAMFAALLAPLLIVRSQARNLASWLERRSGRVARIGREALHAVPSSTAALAEQWTWTLFAWAGKIVAHGLIIAGFASVAVGPSLIGALGGELFSILPIHGPASLGTYEAGIVAVMVAVDVPFRRAMSGAVNLHLVVLCVSTLAGLAAVLVPARQSGAVTE
jgi:glycosyltransferase 2 family protein